jgi:hypothetical protein
LKKDKTNMSKDKNKDNQLEMRVNIINQALDMVKLDLDFFKDFYAKHQTDLQNLKITEKELDNFIFKIGLIEKRLNVCFSCIEVLKK